MNGIPRASAYSKQTEGCDHDTKPDSEGCDHDKPEDSSEST